MLSRISSALRSGSSTNEGKRFSKGQRGCAASSLICTNAGTSPVPPRCLQYTSKVIDFARLETPVAQAARESCDAAHLNLRLYQRPPGKEGSPAGVLFAGAPQANAQTLHQHSPARPQHPRAPHQGSQTWSDPIIRPDGGQLGQSNRKGVPYVSNIRKFGPLFDVLTVFRTVFGMVFGLSTRFRGGIRAGLAKWAPVGALVFRVVIARAASSTFR